MPYIPWEDTSSLVKPFTDVAVKLGLNTKDMSGGGIVYDFKRGKKELYHSIGRYMLADQAPGIKKMFLKHADFANAKLNDIYKNKDGLLELICDETASCRLENTGNGNS